MNEIKHKEVKIKSAVHKNMGYSDSNYWSVSRSRHDKDTFVSTVTAKGEYGVKVNILYEGKPSETPIELLESLLCVGDSSYNPSRPFRWYKNRAGFNNICADTNDPADIIKCRNESFQFYLNEIDNPEKIFIYEIEVLHDNSSQ